MKKTAGIIAEYNPIHRGHQYHIQQTRHITQADYIIVAMSGDYVQRGTPAVFDKYHRTRMALLSGADLVVELPVCYATASAEYFALGGIWTLDSLGIVTDLCFGSESGDLSSLLALAKLLLHEPEDYQLLLRTFLKKGFSFPIARREALLSYINAFSDLPKGQWSKLLESPNNILGIEYLKALNCLHSHIQPHTIPRDGSCYHETQLPDSSIFTSASALRRALSSSAPFEQLAPYLPSECRTYFQKILASGQTLWTDDFSLLLHMRLIQENADSLTRYVDVSPELANRIENHKAEYRSFSQFTGLLKTKDLTHTRIQRALLHILLGITELSFPPYIRLLGVRRESRELLSLIQRHSSIPVCAGAGRALRDLPASSYGQIRQQFYPSELYQSVLSHKTKAPYVPEHSRPLIVV